MRSAGVRFAVIYALLLGVSAAALALFLWWATAGLLDRQTEAAIQADVQSLSERFFAGRLPALVLTIEDRLTQNVEDDAIYLLADPAGRRIAGNLDHWPQSVTQSAEWYELPIERAGGRSLALVQSYPLPGGFRLLIGRDIQLRAHLRSLLTDALLWALLVVLAMASFGAVVVRSLFRRTLANVSATAASIAAGDFTQRVQLTGRGDEFDQLAETINDMLDRMGRLMEGVREVSNAIAHDLRTPITRARARLEDATAHAGSAEELRGAIERATADLDGIVAVFQALLRIAEIEAGSRRSAFARFDLAPVLADVAELYGPVAEETGDHALRRGAGASADPRRPRPGSAGGRQPRGQRGEVLTGRRCRADLGRRLARWRGDLGGRPGPGHSGARPTPRDRALLPRRDRTKHARLRAGAGAGTGGGPAARWQPASARCSTWARSNN